MQLADICDKINWTPTWLIGIWTLSAGSKPKLSSAADKPGGLDIARERVSRRVTETPEF